mmetsp:Transcript_25578/g.36023  ORF Transcript_25578/g.36023 Transcript_25578/m.36023 type:complete len:284 (-) Transcript_25578:97-948(-)
MKPATSCIVQCCVALCCVVYCSGKVVAIASFSTVVSASLTNVTITSSSSLCGTIPYPNLMTLHIIPNDVAVTWGANGIFDDTVGTTLEHTSKVGHKTFERTGSKTAPIQPGNPAFCKSCLAVLNTSFKRRSPSSSNVTSLGFVVVFVVDGVSGVEVESKFSSTASSSIVNTTLSVTTVSSGWTTDGSSSFSFFDSSFISTFCSSFLSKCSSFGNDSALVDVSDVCILLDDTVSTRTFSTGGVVLGTVSVVFVDSVSGVFFSVAPDAVEVCFLDVPAPEADDDF